MVHYHSLRLLIPLPSVKVEVVFSLRLLRQVEMVHIFTDGATVPERLSRTPVTIRPLRQERILLK
ncbi:hypothetical protein D3C71_898730 [compost metagenome]